MFLLDFLRNSKRTAVWSIAPFVAIGMGALLLHAASALPWRYSWVRTLELFLGALTDSYFIVMAFVALTAGLIVSNHQQVGPSPKSRLIHGILAAFVLAVLVVVSQSYGTWDYLFLLPVFVAVVLALRRRDVLSSCAGLMATVLVLVIVSYVFTIYKSQLFVARTPLDKWIVEGELLFFPAPLYQVISGWARSNPVLVSISDWVYYLFFHHMALTALFLFSAQDQCEQWRYLTTLSLCYLLGGVTYFLYPAMGPVFYDPESFSYLEELAPFTVSIQVLLRSSTDAAVAGNLKEIETFAFIAAMPSLHMAHETIMLFFSRKSFVMLAFSAVFWVSSLLAVFVLGWHYPSDVVGGVVFAVIVLALGRCVVPLTIEPPRLH